MVLFQLRCSLDGLPDIVVFCVGWHMNQQGAPARIEPADPRDGVKRAKTFLLDDSVTAYLLIILLVVIATYLASIRSQSIFLCPATGYSSDSYLAYCHATHYGDYDHGAFWFGLEPQIRESVQTAEVLFLGNSRMQFGFSSNATDSWFATNSAKYYLMGFAYWENYLFERALLQQLKPAARVYVINLDTFFADTETPPAKIVMHDRDASARYKVKKVWQWFHAGICSRFERVCGTDESFFRSRRTGGYELHGGRVADVPASYNEVVDQAIARDYTARARQFIANLPVDSQCVLLTIVPTVNTSIATARAIAASLGTTLIAPDLAGLSTFDKSHMDKPSAERWSGAFFESAGPRIRQCLGHAATASR
jgi:hypothetical protein